MAASSAAAAARVSPPPPPPRRRPLSLTTTGAAAARDGGDGISADSAASHHRNRRLPQNRMGGHRRCPTNRRRTGVASAALRDDTPTGYDGTTWASMSEEARYEEAYDMVVRLATTLNAYEYVAFTSKSTNMGTYVYNALSRIPEQYRGLLINELSDKGGGRGDN